MKRMERLVALLVAVVTMASLCVFSISASAEETALPTIEVTDADLLKIEKLEALGVIDAKYDPATYVTRRNLADIIVKYMNLSASSGSSAETPFRDVTTKDASFASIRTLYDMGIITGDDQLRFNPDNYVTYDEALVFIINAIGHKMFAVREGGYPTGYHRVAIKHNMLKGLAMQKGTDPVHFPDLYKMLESALDAASVVPQYYGDGSVTYTLSETDTYLYETFGIRKYHGIVTGNENTKLTSADSSLTDEQIEIDGQLYETPGYVYDYFLGYAVDYYVKVNSLTDAEMVYIEEARNYNEVTKVDAEDILPGKTTSSRIYYTDEENPDKEYHISFVGSMDVIYNNQCWTGYGSLQNVIPSRGYIEALDNNNDGVADVLFIYEYVNYIVDAVDSYDQTFVDRITNGVVSLDSYNKEVVIYYAGETKKRLFNSVTVDSVLSIIESKGTDKVTTVYIGTDIAEGKITAYQSELGYQIGENWYEPAYNYYGTALTVGLEGSFYLDMNGNIATYKYSSTNEDALTAVVAAMDYKITNFSSRVTLKLFTTGGTFEDIDLDETVRIDNVKYDLTDSAQANDVLNVISNGYQTEGKYKVNNTYVIMYQVNDGVITHIDTGLVGGPGKLNTIVDNWQEMLVRSNYMLNLQETSTATDRKFSRYNNSTGIIFGTPADITDYEGYQIYTGFKVDHYYSATKTGYTGLSNFTLYSNTNEGIPTVDIMLFRGLGVKTISTSTSFAVVTDVADAVDEDGTAVKKLYLNGEDSLLVASQVTVTDATRDYVEATEVSSSVLFTGSGSTPPKLRPGVVIQYTTNTDGMIGGIKFVAEYDNSAKEVVPLFKGTDSNAYQSLDLGASATETSLVVCEVVENDTKSSLLQVTIGGTKEALLYTGGNISIVTFMSDKNDATLTELTDIKTGDKFVARLDDYFAIKQIVKFR